MFRINIYKGGGSPIGRVLATAAVFLFLLAWGAPLRAEPEPKHFLWSLESPQGRPAYILGSIHLAYSGLYPLDVEIMNAFGEAEALVVEINTEDMDLGTMQRFILEHGLARDARPLPERLTPRTRQALESSGLYGLHLASMAPWLAALTIQVEVMERNGFRAEYGLDKFFIDEAKRRRLRILELESLEDQMGMLVSMSPEVADLFLLSSLLEMDELPRTMRTFLETWQRGDVAGFGRAFFDEYEKYPELVPVLDIIIFRRNRDMAAKIDRLAAAEAGPLFIVIGAGHLVGEGSVLDELAGRGWRARQH